jgi:hypothetical protein
LDDNNNTSGLVGLRIRICWSELGKPGPYSFGSCSGGTHCAARPRAASVEKNIGEGGNLLFYVRFLTDGFTTVW